MDEASEQEIRRQFVDDAIFRRPDPAHAFDIGLSKLPEVFTRHFGEHVRVRARSALRDIRHCVHKIIELSGSEDARMAGEDLFDKARARARHADDKDRRLRVMSDIGSGAQDIAGECAADALHKHQGSALVIRHVLPLETIAGVQMTKRTVWVLEVGISLSKREVQYDPLTVGRRVLSDWKS